MPAAWKIEGGRSRKDRISSKMLFHCGQSEDLSVCVWSATFNNVYKILNYLSCFNSPPQVPVRGSIPHSPKLFPIAYDFQVVFFFRFPDQNSAHISEEEEGWGVCYLWGRTEVHTNFWWGKLRERDDLEDLLIGKITILKWIFKKYDGSLVWTDLAQDKDKGHWYETLISIKCGEFF